MTPRARLEARIPVALKRDLTTLARQQRVALTDLVEAALQQLLAPPPPEPSVTAHLARVLRELRALLQAVEVLEETLGLFINVYFSTTPEVPPEHEAAASQRGGRRYARFLRVLDGKLAQVGRGTTREGGDDDPDSADGAGPGA